MRLHGPEPAGVAVTVFCPGTHRHLWRSVDPTSPFFPSSLLSSSSTCSRHVAETGCAIPPTMAIRVPNFVFIPQVKYLAFHTPAPGVDFQQISTLAFDTTQELLWVGSNLVWLGFLICLYA